MRKTVLKRLFAWVLVFAMLCCTGGAMGAGETTSDAAGKIKLVDSEGTVTVTNSAQKPVQLSSSGEARLYSGYHIVTGKDSNAWFSLDDSKTVKLYESSEVEVRKNKRKLELLLISGALCCDVSQPVAQGETFNIRTSTMVTGIRGTMVVVDVGWTQPGADTVTMLHGTSEVHCLAPVSGALQVFWLEAGQVLSCVRGEPLSKIAPIHTLPGWSPSAFEEIPEHWPLAVSGGGGAAGSDPAPLRGQISNVYNGDSSESTGSGGSGTGYVPGVDDYVPGLDTPEAEQLTLVLNGGEFTGEALPDSYLPGTETSLPGGDSLQREGYSFGGWYLDEGLLDGPVSVIGAEETGEKVFYARWIRNTYTVIWQGADSSELEKDENVEYGAEPSYDGAVPTKEADAQYVYEFSGWDREVAPVTGNVTFTAQFSSTDQVYTLADDGWTWNEIDDDWTAEAEFRADVGDFRKTADAVVTSEKQDPTCLEDGITTYTAVISAEDSPDGLPHSDVKEIVLPALGHEWNAPSFDWDLGEKIVTATFTCARDSSHTETVDGTFGVTETAEKYIYSASVVFDGETYTATREETRSYTVTFLDDDGVTVLQSSEVPYGETPAYTGTAPTKAATAQYTYAFSGWSPAITSVTGEASYTATYGSTVNEYTITFLDEDGVTVLQTLTVPYGETPVYTGTAPTKAATAQYTYAFSGWSPAVTAVTGETSYTATYGSTVNEYTITFLNGDGTVLQSSEVPYGDTPSITAAPTKAATAQYTYTFSGWSPAITSVTGEATYTPNFSSTVNEYTITFLDEDGVTVLQTITVPYGDTPVFTETVPTRTGDDATVYQLSGWTPEITEVDGPADYTAVYKPMLAFSIDSTIGDGFIELQIGKYRLDDASITPLADPREVGWTSQIVNAVASSSGGDITPIYSLIVSFDDIKPTSMAGWFSGLTGIKEIQFESLGEFTLPQIMSEVTDMSYLFANGDFQTLNLREFDTQSVTNMTGMFNDCSELSMILASDTFDVSSVPADTVMFDGCVNLSGGFSTPYDPSHVDVSYAHVDQGEFNPGYFTPGT